MEQTEKKIRLIIPILIMLGMGITTSYAQSGDPLMLLKEIERNTLAFKDQNIQFSLFIEAPGRDGNKVRRKTSGQVTVVGETALLKLQGQQIFIERNRFVTVSDDDEEIVVRKLDGEETQYTPSALLKKYETGSNFQWAGEETTDNGVKVKYVRMRPKNDPSIRDIIIGINMDTKRIYSYKEFGSNDVTTLLRINQYEVNSGIPASKVSFNRSNYPGYDYVAPNGM